jgi:signal transduction histidine kinase
MRMSLSKKVSLITILLFISMFIIQIVFQSVFLEKFYFYNRIDAFSNEYIEINNELGKTSTNEYFDKIKEFSKDTNSYVLMLDSNLNTLYSTTDGIIEPYVAIETEIGEKYKVKVNTSNLEDINIGDDLYVEGDEFEGELFPYFIIHNDNEYNIEELETEISAIIYSGNEAISITDEDGEGYLPMYEVSEETLEEEDYYSEEFQELYPVIKTSGRIYELFTMEEYNRQAYRENQIFNNLDTILDPMKAEKINGVEYYKFTDTVAGVDSIILRESKNINGVETMILAVINLKNFQDNIQVFSQFLIYMMAVASVLAIIGSLIYSRILTRPIVEINRVALKMKELDFSEKAVIDNNDELGDLSNSLNQMADNLEKSLTDLKNTNESLQNEVNYSKKMEEFRKEFIGNISHELKTPITIAKGISEGIREDILEKEGNMEDLIEELDIMDKLVKQMMELTKLDSDKYKLNSSVEDLGELYYSQKYRFKNIISEKSMSFNEEIGEHFSMIDRDMFSQVFGNLISNAIKYSDLGSTIDTRLFRKDDKIVFTIENQCENLSEDDIERIWDEFYRVEKSRNRKRGGTGLGLIIVKKVLAAHGGEIRAINTKKGVKFIFYMDIYDEKKNTP